MSETVSPSESRRPLRLGEAAPNFSARTTLGHVQLKDYRGRWLLLFSHPADFTPVGTSEILAFAAASKQFAARGCELLGLSVDSLYSHLAWIEAIHRHFGVTVTFPIIEDPSMAIGAAYGMADKGDPDSSSVRCAYVIDPEGVIRAITWYPPSVGWSVDELLRLVDALQRTAAGDVLAPEGWRPGKSLLLPTAQGSQELHQILNKNQEIWFYREHKDDV